MAAHGTDMTGNRGRETPAGAWLATIAMLLQVLLPVLVGFAMSDAATAGGSDTHCLLMHASGPSGAPDATPPAHHHGGGAPAENAPYGKGLVPCCPLCTALQAVHGFTTPPAIGVPAPRFNGSVASVSADEPLVATTYSAAYSSRAPPLNG
jgi:hypothetical protein